MRGFSNSCVIDTDEKRVKALKLYPAGEVWGIGRRYSAKMEKYGIKTAYDFAAHSESWVRATFNNVVICRTWAELNGDDCVPDEEQAKRKSVCVSRSFNGMVSDIETLRTHVSNYAARCAEKLRSQGSVASTVGVFINTNTFREDLEQYTNYHETRLVTPSNSTVTIVSAANEALQAIFRPGYRYKRAGVVLTDVANDSPVQVDLLGTAPERYNKLRHVDEAIDRINRLYGTETVVLCSQQYPMKGVNGKAEVFANVIKHDFRSPNPTTRWSDIIKLK